MQMNWYSIVHSDGIAKEFVFRRRFESNRCRKREISDTITEPKFIQVTQKPTEADEVKSKRYFFTTKYT